MNLSIGVNVELTDVLEAYDGESFQWYFSIVESFNGIFLKIGSFNGTQLIFLTQKETAGCSMQVRWRGRRDTGNDAGRNWDGFGLVVAAGGIFYRWPGLGSRRSNWMNDRVVD